VLRLPPISIYRWIGEWFYYNFAAGRFHTKKLSSRLYSIELELFTKTTNSLFEPFYVELGVTYALHICLVGKRVVDFLFAIFEHFSLALTVDTL